MVTNKMADKFCHLIHLIAKLHKKNVKPKKMLAKKDEKLVFDTILPLFYHKIITFHPPSQLFQLFSLFC